MNRAIKDEDLTQTVALYSDRWGGVQAYGMVDWIEESTDYVRVSEPLEITFTALPDKDVLKDRVDAIDKQIETVRAELTRKVNDLTDQRHRLLAITHDKS